MADQSSAESGDGKVCGHVKGPGPPTHPPTERFPRWFGRPFMNLILRGAEGPLQDCVRSFAANRATGGSRPTSDIRCTDPAVAKPPVGRNGGP